MSQEKNFFMVLGLETNASREDVKRAFKELAFQFHPDRNPHNPAAEERFKQVVEAYSHLTGNLEALRALQAKPGRRKGAPGELDDILKILFDIEWQGVQRKTRPIEVGLTVSAEEAFSGGDYKISVSREELCAHCQGRGVEPGAKIFTCTYCFGAGEIFRPGETSDPIECPKCNGRGILSSQGCLPCKARGAIERETKLLAHLPAKSGPQSVLVLSGQGHELAPGTRGDVWVHLAVRPHPSFTFDGKDIICETTVPMGIAALGGEIHVPSLNGSARLTLPPGTQSGQVFRIKGLGLGGDQFVKIQVKTPTPLTERERQLLSNLEDETSPRGFWQKIKKLFW